MRHAYTILYIRGSCSSKNIVKFRWSVHLRWAGILKKQAFSTVFDPHHLLEPDATERHIWPNVYVADALLREPIRIVRAQPALRADGSMAQTCRCVVFTWNLAPGVFERFHPVRFITGHGTIPMPTS